MPGPDCQSPNPITPIVMPDSFTYITINGKWVKTAALKVGNETVVVTGRWIRMAEIHNEEWLAQEPVIRAGSFIPELKRLNAGADCFTFSQTACNPNPGYKHYMEWDNAAAISTKSFADWWEKDLPQVTRKNVRRSQKRGVVVREMKLDGDTISRIHRLYNQIQVKQGTQFAHFGKDLETVRRELSTFPERSEFLGAFHEDELIGFVKLIYMQNAAGIMHLVSRDEDYDKRPANALIAKAVQVCEAKGLTYLTYGKYTYGNKTRNPLTEFKRRMGFKKIEFPRYYIPLNLRGRIILRLRLHRGMLGLLPAGVINLLLRIRSACLKRSETEDAGSGSETDGASSERVPAPSPVQQVNDAGVAQR